MQTVIQEPNTSELYLSPIIVISIVKGAGNCTSTFY